jgi:hypothetical protein
LVYTSYLYFKIFDFAEQKCVEMCLIQLANGNRSIQFIISLMDEILLKPFLHKFEAQVMSASHIFSFRTCLKPYEASTVQTESAIFRHNL